MTTNKNVIVFILLANHTDFRYRETLKITLKSFQRKHSWNILYKMQLSHLISRNKQKQKLRVAITIFLQYKTKHFFLRVSHIGWGGEARHPPPYYDFFEPPPRCHPMGRPLLKNEAHPIRKTTPSPPIETWNTLPWNDSLKKHNKQ